MPSAYIDTCTDVVASLYLPLTTHVEASWDLRPLTHVGPLRLLTRLELCLTPAVSSCRANSASEAANEQHCNKDPTLLSELGFFTCDLISNDLMSTILAEQIAPYHINGTRTSVTVLDETITRRLQEECSANQDVRSAMESTFGTREFRVTYSTR